MEKSKHTPGGAPKLSAAETIREWRWARRLSRVDFAMLISPHNHPVPVSRIIAWETGNRNPDALLWRVLELLEQAEP